RLLPRARPDVAGVRRHRPPGAGAPPAGGRQRPRRDALRLLPGLDRQLRARPPLLRRGDGGLAAAHAGARLAARGRCDEPRRRAPAALPLCAALGVAGSAAILLLAAPVVRLLYGGAFAGAAPLLRGLAPMPLLLAVESPYFAWLLVNGGQKRIAAGVTLSAV